MVGGASAIHSILTRYLNRHLLIESGWMDGWMNGSICWCYFRIPIPHNHSLTRSFIHMNVANPNGQQNERKRNDIKPIQKRICFDGSDLNDWSLRLCEWKTMKSIIMNRINVVFRSFSHHSAINGAVSKCKRANYTW